MLKLASRVLGAILLMGVLVIAAGGVQAMAAPKPALRGEMVDIGGGRRLRIVCAGPKSDKPLVVTESGIFGFAADWGAVQDRLAAEGIRSCAYDRAGLGFSDPGPEPRDGVAIAGDLEKLLVARGETGPLILLGHSMAGLNTRLFILRNPGRVRGLVLADGMSPWVVTSPNGQAMLKHFATLGDQAEWAAGLGLLRLASPFAGDSIGLPSAAHAEKVWFFGTRAFNHAAAAENRQAGVTARQVLDAGGRIDPDIPVAVVTEGKRGGATTPWGRGRAEAALNARHGFFENIENASHASMIGRDHAEVIVRAVKNVMAVAAGEPAPFPELAIDPSQFKPPRGPARK